MQEPSKQPPTSDTPTRQSTTPDIKSDIKERKIREGENPPNRLGKSSPSLTPTTDDPLGIAKKIAQSKALEIRNKEEQKSCHPSFTPLAPKPLSSPFTESTLDTKHLPGTTGVIKLPILQPTALEIKRKEEQKKHPSSFAPVTSKLLSLPLTQPASDTKRLPGKTDAIKFPALQATLKSYYGAQGTLRLPLSGQRFFIKDMSLTIRDKGKQDRREKAKKEKKRSMQGADDEKEVEGGGKDQQDVFRSTPFSLKEEWHHINKPIAVKDLFAIENSTKPTRRILVEGCAGIGKTTFSQYLVWQWAAQGLYAADYDYVLWAPLRCWLKSEIDPDISFAQDLAQFIVNHHAIEISDQDTRLDELEAILSSDQQQRTLLILDGYDEVAYLEANTSAGKLLQAALCFPQVIVTTRDDQRLPADIRFDRELLNIGFTDAQISNYIRSFCEEFVESDGGTALQMFLPIISEKQETKEKKYEKADPLEEKINSAKKPLSAAQRLEIILRQNPRFWRLAHIPPNLALICEVMQANLSPIPPTSLTDLYQEVVQHFIKCYLNQQERSLPEVKHKKDVKPLRSPERDTLRLLAWEGFMTHQSVLMPLEGSYLQLTHHLLERNLTRRGKKLLDVQKTRDVETVIDLCPLELSALRQLAWDSFRTYQLLLTPDMQRKALNALRARYKHVSESIIETGFWQAIGMGFLRHQGGERLSDSPLEQTHYFIYLAFQEYFAADYLCQALQGYYGSAEYEHCLSWIGQNKYQPHCAGLFGFLSGLTVQAGYDRALQAFWSVLLAPPYDIAGKPHLSLIVRCLEETNCDKRILHLRSLLSDIHLCVQKNFQRENIGKHQWFLTLLAQNPRMLQHSLVLKILSQALRDKEKDMRSGAVDVLVLLIRVIITPEILAALVVALKDEAEDIRHRVVDIVNQLSVAVITSDEVLAALVVALKDEAENIRRRVVDILSQLNIAAIASDEVLAALVEALKDKVEDIQCCVADILGQLGVTATEKVLNALQGALKDEKQRVRSRAAQALGNLGEIAAKPEILLALVEALKKKDEVGDVRSYMIWALGNLVASTIMAEEILSEVLIVLVAALKDKNKNVRLRAVEALDKLEVSTATSAMQVALAEKLGDEDYEIRKNAFLILSKLGIPATMPKPPSSLLSVPLVTTSLVTAPSLIEALKDKDDNVRINALSTLSKQGASVVTSEILDILVAMLKEKNPQLQEHTIEVLGELGEQVATPEVLTALVEILKDRTRQLGKFSSRYQEIVKEFPDYSKVFPDKEAKKETEDIELTILNGPIKGMKIDIIFKHNHLSVSIAKRSPNIEQMPSIVLPDGKGTIPSQICLMEADGMIHAWVYSSGPPVCISDTANADRMHALLLICAARNIHYELPLFSRFNYTFIDRPPNQAELEYVRGLINSSQYRVNAIYQNLYDVNRHLRQRAAEALGKLGTLAAKSDVQIALTQGLNDDNKQVRVFSAQALNKLLTPAIVFLYSDENLLMINEYRDNNDKDFPLTPLFILVKLYLTREVQSRQTTSTQSNPWLPFIVRRINFEAAAIVLDNDKLHIITTTYSESLPLTDVTLLQPLVAALQKNHEEVGLPSLPGWDACIGKIVLYRVAQKPRFSAPLAIPLDVTLYSTKTTAPIGRKSDTQSILRQRRSKPVTTVSSTASTTTVTTVPSTITVSFSHLSTLYEQLLAATLHWGRETTAQIMQQPSLRDEKDSKKSTAADALRKAADGYGYNLENVSKDGNCFYHAVSDQLWRQLSVLISPAELRATEVDHVIKNLGLYNTSVTGSMDAFMVAMSTHGEWADAIHAQALSRALHINLVVVRSDNKKLFVRRRDHALTTVYLGYEVGCRYQSLIPQKIGSSALDLSVERERVDADYTPSRSLEWLKNLGIALPYPLSRNHHEQLIKAFVIAINQGDDQAVVTYLQQGISPNALDSSWSMTPAMLAACAGNVSVMQTLLAADPTHALFQEKDKSGNTALLVAARSGHLAAVQWLNEVQRINPAVANKDGDTPLLTAVRNGHLAVVKYLLQHGAVLTDPNKKGETVFTLAKEKNVREYLAHYAQEKEESFARLRKQLTLTPAEQKLAFMSTTSSTQTLTTPMTTAQDSEIPAVLIMEASSSSTVISMSASSLPSPSETEEKKNLPPTMTAYKPHLFASVPVSPSSSPSLQAVKQKLQQLCEDHSYTFNIKRPQASQLVLQFTALDSVLAGTEEIRKELVALSRLFQQLIADVGITFKPNQLKPDWKHWTLTIRAEPSLLDQIANLLHTASLPYLPLEAKTGVGFFQSSHISSGSTRPSTSDSDAPEVTCGIQ